MTADRDPIHPGAPVALVLACAMLTGCAGAVCLIAWMAGLL